MRFSERKGAKIDGHSDHLGNVGIPVMKFYEARKKKTGQEKVPSYNLNTEKSMKNPKTSTLKLFPSGQIHRLSRFTVLK